MGGSRRQFLEGSGFAIAAIAVYTASTSRAFGSTASSDKASLIAFCRRLYPYDGLDDNVYMEIVDSIVSNPVLSDALKASANALSGFLEMIDAEQLQAIRAMESNSFFEDIRNTVRLEMHNRPELWHLIGYEGPSLLFGVYAREQPASLEWLGLK